MKLPNDLIKATDYSKAKNREIHEFEYRNGKYIHNYVLGGEHELTPQEIIDCLNAISTIDCDLQTAYAYIQSQKDKINSLKNGIVDDETLNTLVKNHKLYKELELKLAESKKSEETYRSMFEIGVENNHSLLKENEQLKQQLATKENTITNLIEDNRASQEWYKKQLAEKEETIKEINKEFVQAVKDWKSLVEQKNKDIAELEEHDNLYHNQLAIEQLEKIRHNILCNEKFYFENLNEYIDEQIDNQIAELTHQHEDK